ncbi:MAG: LacI family DNA-binding transcriptional regulator [Aggregatilineales bacterium]
MPRKAVTLRDVAKHAGVGVSTVSYVLNGRDDHVGAATRELILNTARDLGYRRNAIARSMVRKQTATIGLIISELQNPLFPPITVGVEAVLRQEGYQIILANAETAEGEIQAIDILRGQQVDGIILMSLSRRYPTVHLRRLHDEEFPFVVINRDLDDPDIYQIQFDDRGAGRAATEHLIRTGRQQIGIITGPLEDVPNHRKSAVERLAGWREALEAHGLPVNPEWIAPGDYTFEGGYRAVRDLFVWREGSLSAPDALFASSDMIATGALKALADLGLSVPHDLPLVAVGDPPYAAYTVPALTTLVMPIVEAGEVAARELVNWLRTGHPAGPKLRTLGFTLQVRESCGLGHLPRFVLTAAHEEV